MSYVAARLRGRTRAEVLELHGQIGPAEQDRAVSGREPGGSPRIIVSTSLAESSLTVPGVRLVIDSGLSREPRRDAGRGMSGLVNVSCSRASAEQRAGRAARRDRDGWSAATTRRPTAPRRPTRRRRSPSRTSPAPPWSWPAGDRPAAAGCRCRTPRRRPRWTKPLKCCGNSARWRRTAWPRISARRWPGYPPIPGWPGPCWTARPPWGTAPPRKPSRWWPGTSAPPAPISRASWRTCARARIRRPGAGRRTSGGWRRSHARSGPASYPHPSRRRSPPAEAVGCRRRPRLPGPGGAPGPRRRARSATCSAPGPGPGSRPEVPCPGTNGSPSPRFPGPRAATRPARAPSSVPRHR